VKDLLRTMPNLSPLSQVIEQVIRCDNMLFKMLTRKASWTNVNNTMEFCTIGNTKEIFTYNANPTFGKVAKGPMQIDKIRFKSLIK